MRALALNSINPFAVGAEGFLVFELLKLRMFIFSRSIALTIIKEEIMVVTSV